VLPWILSTCATSQWRPACFIHRDAPRLPGCFLCSSWQPCMLVWFVFGYFVTLVASLLESALLLVVAMHETSAMTCLPWHFWLLENDLEQVPSYMFSCETMIDVHGSFQNFLVAKKKLRSTELILFGPSSYCKQFFAFTFTHSKASLLLSATTI